MGSRRPPPRDPLTGWVPQSVEPPLLAQEWANQSLPRYFFNLASLMVVNPTRSIFDVSTLKKSRTGKTGGKIVKGG